MYITHKRILSAIIAVTIVFSFIFCNTISIEAAHADLDIDSKRISIYVSPYDGVKAESAFLLDYNFFIRSGVYAYDYNIEATLVDIAAKKTLDADDTLVAGKDYRYKAVIKIIRSPYSINENTVKIINFMDPNDTKFYRDSKVTRTDDSIECECTITAKQKIDLNLGKLNVDFTKIDDYSDDRYYYGDTKRLYTLLDELAYEKTINRYAEYDKDKTLIRQDFDLDKDGNYDLTYQYFRTPTILSFRVSDTNNLHGEYSFTMPKRGVEYFERRCNYYYDSVTFKFPEEVSQGTDTNSDNTPNASTDGDGAGTDGANADAAGTDTVDSKNTSDKGGSASNDSNTGKAANAGSSSNNTGASTDTGNTSTSEKPSAPQYKNEWVNGRWYNFEGVITYTGILMWKCNSTGWWVEDTTGWYPVNQWQKIDGKWYYFTETGYMDYSEYRDGYWLGADGAMVDGYYGEWKCDSKGWWFEDASGWYPSSQWLWINGNCYYFKSDGYMAVNEYIDGCWVNESGVWE